MNDDLTALTVQEIDGRLARMERQQKKAIAKAKTRATAADALRIDLDQAAKLANEWARCMERGRPGATDQDIESAFKEIALWIARAQLHQPR